MRCAPRCAPRALCPRMRLCATPRRNPVHWSSRNAQSRAMFRLAGFDLTQLAAASAPRGLLAPNRSRRLSDE